MEATLTQYLIICPMVFLAGFVDSVAGGGGLISLPAYLVSGLPAHWAIGTNKLSSGMGTALTTWRYAKSGYIDWRRDIFCAAAALAGSAIGAYLALLLEDRVFRLVMLAILPFSAVYILRGRALETDRPPYPPRKTAAIGVAVAFSIGIYDGFYGPGTGTFLLLLLTGLAHMELHAANGTAKVINLSTNLSALAVFLTSGRTILPLGLAAGCFSLLGNYLGSRLFQKQGVRSVKPLMLAVFLVFFVKLMADLLV